MSARLLVLTGALLLSNVAGSAKSLTIHVAANGNDHWSGRLDRPRRDGKDGPGATLPAAFMEARAARAHPGADGPPTITVLLHGGVYGVTGPVVVKPEDSGLDPAHRSEEHTSELQSHSFISYAVFCLKK